LIDDSSRISRGEVKLDTLDGTYLLAEGDNTVASQLAALLSSPISFRPAGSLSGTTVSFSDYAASIISRNSTEAAAAETNLTLQDDLRSALDLKSAEASGVNLDEEMTGLIIFQQSYAASAKVISTTQKLFEILNNIIR
jgi:flagellar hook-associated protein 1 FlgK